MSTYADLCLSVDISKKRLMVISSINGVSQLAIVPCRAQSIEAKGKGAICLPKAKLARTVDNPKSTHAHQHSTAQHSTTQHRSRYRIRQEVADTHTNDTNKYMTIYTHEKAYQHTHTQVNIPRSLES